MKIKYKWILVQSWFTLCTNVINVMGGAFRLWESISIWECISVMIMFMKGEYIIRYSYTYHMLKIASNQCYERCFRLWEVHIHMGVHFSYGSAIQL